MNASTSDRHQDLKTGLESLRTLRDEIRLQVHLMGMDAKERWSAIEAQLEALEESAARSAATVTRASLDAAIARLHELRATFEKRS